MILERHIFWLFNLAAALKAPFYTSIIALITPFAGLSQLSNSSGNLVKLYTMGNIVRRLHQAFFHRCNNMLKIFACSITAAH
jgi:hypothetical protein